MKIIEIIKDEIENLEKEKDKIESIKIWDMKNHNKLVNQISILKKLLERI